MCYTVIKIITQCAFGHAIRMSPCWRQCGPASQLAAANNQWNYRCDDYYCAARMYLGPYDGGATGATVERLLRCKICNIFNTVQGSQWQALTGHLKGAEVKST